VRFRLSVAISRAVVGLLWWSAGASASGNRDALRQIVHDQCVVNWLQSHRASPCERLYLPQTHAVSFGYAVLKDRKGGAHFLLIPTRAIGGLESPELLEPGAPNYFGAAWRARDQIAASVGHSVPRSAVGLAINPAHARTQDQFHIHIECLRTDVAKALNGISTRVGGRWLPVHIGAAQYQAMRIPGEELGDQDPIRLLAERLPQARESMAEYTLVVAGFEFADGPGFIALAGKGPAGELLMDSTCAVAGI